ncbi:hypothetical protein [Micromonospora sp. NBRC 107095]|uniref:hypothetical protein n=1 Tax=Micromonospora sp. NBRC 107095 TaxID=3032209 RepID=UPI0024A2DB73|nr:hypothetical protein [Micromonospora sp. NBRC 107095]GLZ62320.1 hypothetical protein Misp05_58960 [Micromonospora sp. NBRC 107095]
MTSLEKDSQDACASALRRYGFVPKRRGILLQPRGVKDVTGWLGLNLATWALPAKMQINPVVGVRHVPLEKALVELADWKAPVACVSKPLGYLMPRNTFAQWDFPAGGDLVAIAEDLAAAVAGFGQPFIDKWANWDTFSEGVTDAGLLLDNQKLFVLPLVAAINGDRRRAESLIEQELDRIDDAPDVYSKSYRLFAEKFAARRF